MPLFWSAASRLLPAGVFWYSRYSGGGGGGEGLDSTRLLVPEKIPFPSELTKAYKKMCLFPVTV